MRKLIPPVALSVLAALVGGCSPAAEYTFSDTLRLSVHRSGEGIALLELSLGPLLHPCSVRKYDVALKGLSPTALLTRRPASCRV